MEPIQFKCGGCGKEIEAPASTAGRNGKCPFCGHSNYIPEPADEDDQDILPLAPIDEEEEKHMREEVEHLMDQEKVLLSDDHADNAPPLEQREDLSSEDLHHFVVNYCLDMSKSDLERAKTHVAKLKQFKYTGLQAVEDFVTGKVLEPALDLLPRKVLNGFLEQLSEELR